MGQRFNELLGSAAGVSRALAVMFGIQEQEGATTLSPELQPTFALDETAHPAFYHLRGGSLIWVGNNLAAEVGAREESYWCNPLGSGVLAVVEAVEIVTTIANGFQIGFLANGAPGGTVGASAMQFRDFRRIGTAGIACTNRVNPAATGATTWLAQPKLYQLPATSTYLAVLNLVVPPGYSVGVRPDADNEGFACNWSGRERPAAPLELA